MKRILGIALTLFPLVAQCELYRDIGPLDSFGEVKSKFPGAIIKKLAPAWAQPTDALYQFTGNGLSGTIIVKFEDGRPIYKQHLESGVDDTLKDFYLRMVNKSDDDALSVSWVRWIPATPFSIQRLISKYGPVEKSAFSDEDYQPYREWERKGVRAFLSDDEKYVLRIDYSFTKDEHRKAWLLKHQMLPEWLKDDHYNKKKK